MAITREDLIQATKQHVLVDGSGQEWVILRKSWEDGVTYLTVQRPGGKQVEIRFLEKEGIIDQGTWSNIVELNNPQAFMKASAKPSE